MEFATLDDVLAFAIAREEAAAELYARLAKNASGPGMREALYEFAKQERGHRARLLRLRDRELPEPPSLPVPPSEVAELPPDADYRDALLFAIEREKEASELYSQLAEVVASSLEHVFRDLAAEEDRHRSRFEREYLDLARGV
jgi:rubrerythrin